MLCIIVQADFAYMAHVAKQLVHVQAKAPAADTNTVANGEARTPQMQYACKPAEQAMGIQQAGNIQVLQPSQGATNASFDDSSLGNAKALPRQTAASAESLLTQMSHVQITPDLQINSIATMADGQVEAPASAALVAGHAQAMYSAAEQLNMAPKV
jgi:hypothetical protein